MNVYELEALVRAADSLRNYNCNTKGDKVHEQLLDRVAAELAKVETADGVRALQVSNDIKQANLNLLAGKVIEFIEARMEGSARGFSMGELKDLAASLIQEEPATAEVLN
ncbi:hypothetical protein D3C76_1327910 [compost metagenome]